MAQALIIHGNPTQAATLSRVLQLAGVEVEVAADSRMGRRGASTRANSNS